MNINIIIFFIASVLVSIFVFFQPQRVDSSQAKSKIPDLEIYNFILYEYDTQKLADITTGKILKKYPNSYEMFHFHLKDNKNNTLIDLSADNGVFKNDILALRNNVVYITDDGVEFYTEAIDYNQKKGFLTNTVPFLVKYKKNNTAKGEKLFYDINKKRFHSKNTTAIYNLGK